VDDSQEFTHKLGVNGDNFYKFIPKRKDLGTYHIDIVDELV